MTKTLTERLWVNVSYTGTGDKTARGQGRVGLQPVVYLNSSHIELSLGRSSQSYYNHKSLATAWVKMTPAQAHELAMALLYMTNGEIPCHGDGIKDGKHKTNLSFSVSFETDLCTVLSKGTDLKKEILEAVTAKLDTLDLPKLKETSNA